MENVVTSLSKKSYINGYKYCTRCRVYYKTDNMRCPICSTLLRNSPRKKKNIKRKYISVPSEILEEASIISLKA